MIHRTIVLLLLSLIPLAAREPLDRPNVVVIFLDDSGYGDFSHNGNPVIETPVISLLAAEGVSFTQFHVTSPACSASRYSLMTGRYLNNTVKAQLRNQPAASSHHELKSRLNSTMRSNQRRPTLIQSLFRHPNVAYAA